MASDKKKFSINKRYILNFMVFIIALIIISSLIHEKNLSLIIKDESIQLSFETEEEITINDKDIISIEYTDTFDQGSMVSGTVDDSILYGIWKNAEYGEYKLAINEKIDSYIVVTTTEDTYVFNYENEDTTISFFDVYYERVSDE